MDIKYQSLKIQEYLLEGNKNIELIKFIFKARGQTLNIKTQKKWKYSDKICTGCNIKEVGLNHHWKLLMSHYFVLYRRCCLSSPSLRFMTGVGKIGNYMKTQTHKDRANSIYITILCKI